MAIRLTSLEQMPADIRESLEQFEHLFAGTRFMEHILKNAEMRRVVEELDRLCIEKGVTCFHFTRAVRREIEDRGLEISTGANCRRQFLSRYGNHFSKAQRERIQQTWDNYFDDTQTRARDGRVWFNLTVDAVNSGGADRLFEYFGGEQIYMPLTPDKDIADVLRTIGEALIVECALPTDTLHTYAEMPWGTTWLSTYHLSVNRKALQFDQDVSSRESVPASRIVSIQSYQLRI